MTMIPDRRAKDWTFGACLMRSMTRNLGALGGFAGAWYLMHVIFPTSMQIL